MYIYFIISVTYVLSTGFNHEVAAMFKEVLNKKSLQQFLLHIPYHICVNSYTFQIFVGEKVGPQ